MSDKPTWYILAVTFGCGGGLCLLSAIIFVPYIHAKVIKKDYTVKWYMLPMGPLLWRRTAPPDAERAAVRNYAVVLDDRQEQPNSTALHGPNGEEQGPEDRETSVDATNNEKRPVETEVTEKSYKELQAEGRRRLHKRLYTNKGPLGWAMRTLRDHPMGSGELYEVRNLKTLATRFPAMIVVALLYFLRSRTLSL